MIFELRPSTALTYSHSSLILNPALTLAHSEQVFPAVPGTLACPRVQPRPFARRKFLVPWPKPRDARGILARLRRLAVDGEGEIPRNARRRAARPTASGLPRRIPVPVTDFGKRRH